MWYLRASPIAHRLPVMRMIKTEDTNGDIGGDPVVGPETYITGTDDSDKVFEPNMIKLDTDKFLIVYRKSTSPTTRTTPSITTIKAVHQPLNTATAAVAARLNRPYLHTVAVPHPPLQQEVGPCKGYKRNQRCDCWWKKSNSRQVVIMHMVFFQNMTKLYIPLLKMNMSYHVDLLTMKMMLKTL